MDKSTVPLRPRDCFAQPFPLPDHFFVFDSKVVFYATSALLRFEAIVRVLAVVLKEEEGENSVKVTEKRKTKMAHSMGDARWG